MSEKSREQDNRKKDLTRTDKESAWKCPSFGINETRNYNVKKETEFRFRNVSWAQHVNFEADWKEIDVDR